MAAYSVQFVVIREIVVDSDNDIQAERDAFDKLALDDRNGAIASHVQAIEGNTDPGALADDPMTAWHFAKQHFGSIDSEWLESD
jgi:hypothetical protein